jgi:hypothetical protein
MHQSSNSIANLAAALAKAQMALVNPEKSLVATIRPGVASGAEQAFRYAPLSSGLEIVRKTLGEHEIATVQTTGVDQVAGVVNLTTVLAHSSGEWISSEWPVCALSETATPRRMGAALTYARRYALFTLVGIVGEDDHDAPDLARPTRPTSGPEKPKGHGNGHLNGREQNPAPRVTFTGDRPGKRPPPISAKPPLGLEQSAQLRDRLLAELGTFGFSDDTALWAYRSLADKNRLNAADARLVEEAFETHVTRFAAYTERETSAGEQVERPLPTSDNHPNATRQATAKRLRAKRVTAVVDKSVLAIPEPRRLRDRDHVRYVAQQPCLVCGRQPSDAHHLRFAQHTALSRKVSDEFTVPLCQGHHREIHRHGDEAAWWRNTRIDPTVTARALWLKTHPLPAVERLFEEGAMGIAALDLCEGRSDLLASRRRTCE